MNIKEALRDANPCDGGSDCQCEPGKYFVSAVNGPDWYLMAGPYGTHREAQANRDRALKIADDIDGRAWFMAWGTVHMPNDCDRIGVLNKHKLI